MITRIILLSAVTAFLILPNTCFALRCGSNIANTGDLKNEVLLACGTPFSKEVIGYIDQERNGDRIRVMKIEEWIIEDSNNYYSLVFEGNALVKIESAGTKQKAQKPNHLNDQAAGKRICGSLHRRWFSRVAVPPLIPTFGCHEK